MPSLDELTGEILSEIHTIPSAFVVGISGTEVTMKTDTRLHGKTSSHQGHFNPIALSIEFWPFWVQKG